MAADDGKQRLSVVANPETLLRFVQSVPSPKAEPIKLWLAEVGYERMQEMSDPARALERARATWQKHGRSDKTHEESNLSTGVYSRERTQRAWDEIDRVFPLPEVFIGVTAFPRFAFSAFFRGSTVFLGLNRATRQIAETTAATGMAENQPAAKTAGKTAKRARLELEAKTGKRVVTGENYLPPGSAKTSGERAKHDINPTIPMLTPFPLLPPDQVC